MMPVEGRGVGSRWVSAATRTGRWALSREPPETVRKLRTALPAQAKAAPTYRVYL